MGSERSLEGKTALVTGASRGIGYAIAKAFREAGARVYISGRKLETLQRAADAIGAMAVRCDHSEEHDVRELMAQMSSLDVLVNNAGAAHELASVAELSTLTWRETIDLNLTGMFLATHYALPLMRQGGVIVNNLSVAARGSFTGMSAYVAAKHGALGLTNVLREELRSRGIRVVALIPGAVDTPIWDQFWAEAPREKMVSPETIARLVLNAVSVPEEACVEELVIRPSVGSL